jgi:hypothetical protein
MDVIRHDDILPDDPRRFIAPALEQEFGGILTGQDGLAGRCENRQENEGWFVEVFVNRRVRRMPPARQGYLAFPEFWDRSIGVGGVVH